MMLMSNTMMMKAATANSKVMLAVLALIKSVSGVNDNRTQNFFIAERRPSLDNLVFTDNILWDKEGVSEIHCLQMCADSGTCSSFTSTRALESSMTSCRAYTKVMTSLDAWKDAANSRFYVGLNPYNWQGTSCTSDFECPVVNSECFEGQCLCTPGYFYSINTRTCMSECKSLGNDFVEYPGYHILYHTRFTMTTYPYEACFQKCRDSEQYFSFTCVTMEIDYAYTDSNGQPKKKCVLSTDTALTITKPTHWTVSGPGENWTIFQRVCEDWF